MLWVSFSSWLSFLSSPRPLPRKFWLFFSFLLQPSISFPYQQPLTKQYFFFCSSDKHFVNVYLHWCFPLFFSLSQQCQEPQFNIKLRWFNRYLLLKIPCFVAYMFQTLFLAVLFLFLPQIWTSWELVCIGQVSSWEKGSVSPSVPFTLLLLAKPKCTFVNVSKIEKVCLIRRGLLHSFAQLSFIPILQTLLWSRFPSIQFACVYWFHVVVLMPFPWCLSLSKMSQFDSCIFLGFILNYRICQCKLLVYQVRKSCIQGNS